MQPLGQQSRINLTDLKGQIVRKLGPERSKRYFFYLNKLLSQKLSKVEFDKLCFCTLGRENLPLHNQLIRSILRNACHAKVPPPPSNEQEVPPSKAGIIKAGKKSPPSEEGHQQNGPSRSPVVPTPLSWSNANGDVLPMSPRKIRSGIRERRIRDRPSPLGPNGKADFVSHQTVLPDDGTAKVVMENGDLNSCDVQRPVQHQGHAEQPENEQEASLQRSTKRPRTKKSLEDPVSVHSNKGPVNIVLVEEGEEVEGNENAIATRGPLCAPLGIPFCSASVGGARRPTISSSSSFSSSFDSGGLPDIETLRRRMEQIAGAQGLEGISTDCASLLNNGLDAYLKRLIRSCFELVGPRSGHEPPKPPSYKQQPQGRIINGMWSGQQLQIPSSSGSEGVQESRPPCPVSLLDFKVAMELNPQLLGEDWPSVMEKICLQSWEE